MSRWTRYFGLCLAVALLGSTAAVWQSRAEAQPAQTQPAATSPADPLPHIHVDREHGFLDIEATVAPRNGDWLELLVCTTNGQAYESLLVTPARPQHIHMALLTLGAVAGAPFSNEKVGEKFIAHPPTGGKVRVTILVQRDGKTVEEPANTWVVDQKTNKGMEGDIWLFTGSRFATLNDTPVYVADINGSVASLVNFGDDLLARDTQEKNHSGNLEWNANLKIVPPVGTKVTLRLRPIVPAKMPVIPGASVPGPGAGTHPAP